MQGLTYSFEGLIHRGWEFGTMQGGVVLELRLLHLAGNKNSADSLGMMLNIWSLRTHPHIAHFLQQGHCYSNKATPPKIAIPHENIRLRGPNTFKLLHHSWCAAQLYIAKKPCIEPSEICTKISDSSLRVVSVLYQDDRNQRNIWVLLQSVTFTP